MLLRSASDPLSPSRPVAACYPHPTSKPRRITAHAQGRHATYTRACMAARALPPACREALTLLVRPGSVAAASVRQLLDDPDAGVREGAVEALVQALSPKSPPPSLSSWRYRCL